MSARSVLVFLLTGTLRVCLSSLTDEGQMESKSFCQFDAEHKTYNQTDVLRCFSELTMGLIQEQGDSRAISPEDPIYSSDYEDYPITNDKVLSAVMYQPYNHGLPSYGRPPAHYQTAGAGYLTPQQVLPGGSSFSLYNALTSISRYDDFQCIPRILCEVAAGVIPSSDAGYARSTTSSLIEFGRYAFTGLFNTFDTSGVFPLLNFAKAAVLGYRNRGNSNTCYREYSKCPRNPSDLVDYLNTHNGGFFRLFRRTGAGGIYKNFLGPLILGRKDEQSILPREKIHHPIYPTSHQRSRTKMKFEDEPSRPKTFAKPVSFFPLENRPEKRNSEVKFPEEEKHFGASNFEDSSE